MGSVFGRGFKSLHLHKEKECTLRSLLGVHSFLVVTRDLDRKERWLGAIWIVL